MLSVKREIGSRLFFHRIADLGPLNFVTRILTLVLGILLGHALSGFAQETVTIPKSRLEELERKEAELETLKSSALKSQPTIRTPSAKTGQDVVPEQKSDQAASAPSLPGSRRDTPSIASLPPLKTDEVISAMDLAAHYRNDAAAADVRYRKRTFKIQGEIVSFEKPGLIRNYQILLKTFEPQTRVVCDFYPPEKFKAVYTINNGMVLVGTLPDTRVPLAKVGDTVVIEGRCKGMNGGGIKLTDCELKTVK